MRARLPRPIRTALALAACLLAACQSTPPLSVAGASPAGPQILLTFTQGEEHEAGLLDAFDSGYHRANYGPSLSTRRQIDQVARDYPLREGPGWTITPLGVYCALFEVAPDTDVEALLERLSDDARVESAQRMYTYSTRGEDSYNDPYFHLQYGHASGYILSLHHWSTGRGVQIAIIDTGVDTHHPELAQQVADTHLFLTGTVPGVEQDIHGTAMAGIIAARANNGSGIVGIAPEARLHVLQACRQVAEGASLAECNSFTLAQALSFAVEQRFDVLNLSLSGPYDALVARLVAAALAQGQVVAAADPGPGAGRYPARLPGVIAVREAPAGEATANDADGAMVVYAPPAEVLSTGPGGGYDFYSGSSVATAMVSGLAALSLQRDAAMKPSSRVAWLNQAMRRELTPAAGANPATLDSVAGIAGATTSPQAPEF